MARIVGDQDDNVLGGRDRDDEIEGRGGNDSLSGGAGDDLVTGGTGDDQIYVDEAGDDTASGGAGDDYLQAGDGRDGLYGDAGDDVVYARRLSDGDEPDSLFGGSGFDRVAVNAVAASNVIFGRDGQVVIDGVLTATSSGFEGAFFTSVDFDPQRVSGAAGNDRFWTAYGDDTIEGRGGDDEIDASTGDDRIDAGLGNDDVSIRDFGRDRIDLGAGDDRLGAFTPREPEDGAVGSLNGGRGHDVIEASASLGLEFDGSSMSIGGVLVAEVSNFEAIIMSGRRIVGLSGDDFIGDTEEADKLFGLDGDDSVRGGRGADTLSGGAGDDEVRVTFDANRDRIDGGDGLDQLEFFSVSQPIVMTGRLQDGFTITVGGEAAAIGQGFEELDGSGSSGNDKLVGGGGEDSVSSFGEGRDVVRTFGGDDRVSVALDRGLDRIDLGAGADRAFLTEDTGADVVMSNDDGVVLVALNGRGAARISGAERFLVATGEGDDRLHGGAEDDALLGGSGRNVLKAFGGDDALAVELDATGDRVFGGAGDDALVVGPAFRFADDFDKALVTEVTGEGDFRISLNGRVLLEADSVERVELSDGRGADLLIGQSMADVLRSTINADTLIGGAGDDTLIGAEGAARMDGGQGSDTADLSSLSSFDDFELALDSRGTATPARTFNGDEFARLVRVENVIGGRGDDSITGDARDNVIEGFEGSDTLDGGDGVDTLSFASPLNFDVTVTLAGSADAIVRESNSFDELEFRDVVRNFENVVAGDGNDVIAGDDGDNRLVGSGGFDTLTGGDGADTFVFGDETFTFVKEFDLVRDFSGSEGDKIDLATLAAEPENATPGVLDFIGRQAFSGAGGEVRVERSGGTTTVLIDLDGDREEYQPIVFQGRIEFLEADFLLG